MIALGKMTLAGFRTIEEVKKQGLCEKAYTNLVKERLPPDLKKTLLGQKKVWSNFQHFANSYRDMYMSWVNSAKIEETRKKGIREVVKRSKENKKTRD